METSSLTVEWDILLCSFYKSAAALCDTTMLVRIQISEECFQYLGYFKGKRRLALH